MPLGASLFAALWLGERITFRRASGLILGVAGGAILVGWSPSALTPEVLISIGATLVATCTYALAGVYTKRRFSGVPALTLAVGQQLGAGAWLMVPARWQLPSAQVTRPAALSLVALAVLCTAVAYLLHFRLVASIGRTRTTTVTYLIPVFGTLEARFGSRERGPGDRMRTRRE